MSSGAPGSGASRRADRHPSRSAPFRLLALLLFAGLALLPGSRSTAQEGVVTVQLVGVSTADWPHVQAVVAALDAEGRPVAGLPAGRFQATLNGTPVSISTVTTGVDSTLPVAVVLAIDASGSMEGAPMEQAKEAAGRFLGGLAPGDSVSVLTFHTIVAVLQPFTQDVAVAAQTIASLQAAGATVLYEATAQSVRLAAQADTSRRAVVLLSDGLDHGSAISREDALAPARTLGVPVYTIGLGEEIDRAFLQELADASRGRFVETPSPDGLAALYQEVAEALRGQYVVTLDASQLSLPQAEAAMLRVTAGVAGDDLAICPQPVCISLGAVEDGERLEQQRTVVGDVVAAEPVASVSFLVDGERVAYVAEPPYQYTFDPALFSDGEHTISAEAKTASGETAAAAVDVRAGPVGGGSSNMMLLLLGGGVVIIGGGMLALIFLRRRRRAGPDEEPERVPRSAPFSGGEPITRERVRLWDGEERAPLEPVEETLGHIRVTSGPRKGEAFAVGASPVSIGAGHRCRILLKDEPGAEEIASEHARVWIREGHLMVHEVRRMTDTGSIGGTWEILKPDDTFSIGMYTFQFVLGDEQSAEPPQGAPAAIEPPNVLKETPKPATVAATEPPQAAGEAPAPAAAAIEPVNIFKEKTGRAPVAASEPLPAQAPPDAGAIPNVLRNRPAQQDAPEKNGAPSPDAPTNAGQSSAAL